MTLLATLRALKRIVRPRIVRHRLNLEKKPLEIRELHTLSTVLLDHNRHIARVVVPAADDPVGDVAVLGREPARVFEHLVYNVLYNP